MKNNILKYHVQKEDNGQNIKSVLHKRLQFSRTLLKKIKRTENIILNGKLSKLSNEVNEGDILEIILDMPETATVEPENIPIKILFENEDLMIVDKPAGLVVHPTRRHPNKTLANAVVYYWKKQGYDKIFRPVHRLDKDTSGVLLIAKNHYIHQHLSRQIKNRILKRQYIAVVHGIIKNEQDTINAPISMEPDNGIKRMIDINGQKAITNFKIIKILNNATIIKLSLETGRTHQIRIHMNYYQHPIIGDTLYGGNDIDIQRQALHSHSIKFFNPRNNKIIYVTSKIPDDMKKLIKKLSY
jgi:23S rRNA pseudouridine1911/1915/1917 synthase